MKRHDPIPGDWYKNQQGNSFTVVAVDDDEGTVEIQYFEGEVEELALESWYQQLFIPVAPPEDWSGSFDDLTPDDFGDTERALRPEDWDGPWNELDVQ